MSIAPLSEVLSPREERAAIAAAVLADVPALPGPARGSLRSVDGVILHASRSRPVVRWDIVDHGPTGTTKASVVGKVYNKGDGAAAHVLLTHLRATGFGGAFDVPESLGYLPERRLLLQSEAPRATLHERVSGSAPDATMTNDVFRTGIWLARLHAVTGTDLAPLAADFETIKAEKYVTGMIATKPALTWHLRRIQADLAPLLAAAGNGPLVPTHGDFQQKNVHVDDERIVVIDFDRAALAPAARDLGHFVGQGLTMAAAAGAEFDSATRATTLNLVEGYLAGGGSAAAVAAMPAYVARTFLEVLFYRLVVRPMRDDSFAESWITECERWLDEAALSCR
ncbi:MAG: phosphotransferase [Sporichthyaceae bacterium]